MKAIVLNRIVLVLAFVGLFISGVLSVGEMFRLQVPCGASHGCDVVAMHWSSHALGIPNAYIGFLGYLAIAALAYWRLVAPQARKALVVGFALSAIGTLASLILTFISITVINATCLWCLSSMFVMILLLILHAHLMQTEASDAQPAGMSNGLLLGGLGLALIVGLGIVGGGIVSSGNLVGRVIKDKPTDLFVPPEAHVFGDPNAPVTLLEFGDLLCPACQAQYGKIKEFIALHPGKVKYVFRNFPMYRLKGHEQSAAAAIAAEVAFESGHFWQFVDAMYATQKEGVTDVQPILDVGKSVGLDPKTTLDRIRDEHDKAFARVMKDIDDGSKIGVEGTPTFFILAKDVKGVRQSAITSVYDDLNLPEYKKFYTGG